MNSNQFVFFTFNDFLKDGGETIRIRGIVNALSKHGKDVMLVSNIKNRDGFHSDVKFVDIKYSMNKQQKRVFQFLLSVLPFFVMKFLYYQMYEHFDNVFKNKGLKKQGIIFCGYLDNSLGYFLKKSGLIIKNINDIHGIGPIEFKYKSNRNMYEKIYNQIRYWSACMLDKKVFGLTDGFIFVSNAMKKYFLDLYPDILENQSYIVRDGVAKDFCQQKVDFDLLTILKEKYTLNEEEEIIFFAGNFKDLGGVLDLFEAFKIISTINQNAKLLLVGGGEHFKKIEKEIKQFGLEKKVILTGRVPYKRLKTYQQLADVIVCPDKQHPYSVLVPHIKYFDALASGKIVINGNFDSIKEINENNAMSISFQPSMIDDLGEQILYSLDNKDLLEQKYTSVNKIVCEKYSYDKAVVELLSPNNV